MDIIRVFNGLGNQMSQYAFYLAKKEKSIFNSCWIYMPVDDIEQHNGYELERIFGIRRCKWKDFILTSIYKKAYAIRNKSLRKMIFKFIYDVKENKNYDYDPSLLESQYYRKLTYFFGGWHSERYFKNIKSKIQKVFTFDESMLNEGTVLWKNKIKNVHNSCSIHIRRGDYLKENIWHGCATDDYYDNAIKFITDKLSKDISFFVFSNDINWCRKHFGSENFYYVDCNKSTESWMDMYLISICHHHINANSTFSWWGAWLCKYSDSINIVPKNFQNNVTTKDIYPEEWIKL